ncbi:MAG: HIT family protein [Candidatus Thorarchaeota archaeon]
MRKSNFYIYRYKSYPIDLISSIYKPGDILSWSDKRDDDFPNVNLRICSFCSNNLEIILYKKNGFFIQLDDNPTTESHMLINPISHVYSFASLKEKELKELDKLHHKIRALLEKEYEEEGLGVIFFEHGSTSSEEKKISVSGASVVHAHLQVNLIPKQYDFFLHIKNYLSKNGGIEIKKIKKLSELANRNILPNDVPYLFIENVDGQMWLIIIKDKRVLPSMFLRRVVAEKMGNIKLADWKVFSNDVRAAYNLLIEKSKRKLIPMFENRFTDQKISKQNQGLISINNIRKDILDILYLSSSSKRLFKIKQLLYILMEDLKNSISSIIGESDENFLKMRFIRKQIEKIESDKEIVIDYETGFHFANRNEYWKNLLIKLLEKFIEARKANINKNKIITGYCSVILIMAFAI